jgi:hypothetical protein
MEHRVSGKRLRRKAQGNCETGETSETGKISLDKKESWGRGSSPPDKANYENRKAGHCTGQQKKIPPYSPLCKRGEILGIK